MTYTLACDAGAYVLTGQLARRASSAFCSIPTASIWFPVAPGVTTLPAAPAVVVNPAPAAANQATLPPDWSDAAPDLCYLFQDILPTDQGPVFPSELTPDYVLEPFAETVVLLGITRAVLAVTDLPYALDQGTTAVVAVTRAQMVVIIASLSADAGAYSVAGQDATLRVTYALTADAGDYLVTGEDALLASSAPTATLALEGGSYAVTGQDAGPFLMVADAGRYVIDGQPVQLTKDPIAQMTKLIMHFDGTSGSTFFENQAQTNTLTAEVYGSAQIATDYVKWGTGAGRFSWPPASYGYTGHAVAFDDEVLAPGTGDFTIECWIYIPSTSPILSGTLLSVPTNSIGSGRLITSYVNSTTVYLNWIKDGGSSLTQSTAFALNQWVHVWCVRESGVVKHAVNGTLSTTTVTDATDYAFNPSYLGRKTVIGNYSTGDTYGFGGRIDDLRYTVGYARPLVVPTGPYENI
jgi:hypothetical protein